METQERHRGITAVSVAKYTAENIAKLKSL